MELREAALYHQVHPAKLATDVASSVVSLVLLWHHELLLGLAVTLVPPAIASALVIRLADLDRVRASALGRYLDRWMTPGAQAVRGLGALVMALGAWWHVWLAVTLGLVLVLAAWLRGLAGRIG